MDKQTTGAWVVHHGRKVATDTRGAADYSAIDVAAKTASLLARLAESSQAVLEPDQVKAVARAGGLNPITELPVCLAQLERRRLIETASSGGLSVLGISGRTALTHAADLFEDNDPQPAERAVIGLAEITSKEPLQISVVEEFVSDSYKLTQADTKDLIRQSSEIGFVDTEGDGADRLLFNGNLFRRDTAQKTRRVLDSLQQDEQRRVLEFDELLRKQGWALDSVAEAMLTKPLLSKLKAAALYDMNVVSNEAGDHVFITAPGAFHKYASPLVDDAFDHAKALVAALGYGMSASSETRGRIWGVSWLLGKLLRDEEVGPAPAIGNDYRALEMDRVVQIRSTGGGYYKMRLLKREVGEIALQVLESGNAAAAVLEALPSAGMRGYTSPEVARTRFRKGQSAPSRHQTQSLLSAIRGGTL